jgi:hypothetical protein
LETETAKGRQERRLWEIIRIWGHEAKSSLLGIRTCIYLQLELKGLLTWNGRRQKVNTIENSFLWRIRYSFV